jgi:hypothetical protein
MEAPDLDCQELVDQKRAVVAVLHGCVGKANAKTLAQIAAESGIKDRRLVEELIEHSLADFPWPVVSGADGLWIPTEAVDVTRYYASLRGRIFKMFRRIRTLERKSSIAGFFRRGMVFEKGEGALFR